MLRVEGKVEKEPCVEPPTRLESCSSAGGRDIPSWGQRARPRWSSWPQQRGFAGQQQEEEEQQQQQTKRKRGQQWEQWLQDAPRREREREERRQEPKRRERTARADSCSSGRKNTAQWQKSSDNWEKTRREQAKQMRTTARNRKQKRERAQKKRIKQKKKKKKSSQRWSKLNFLLHNRAKDPTTNKNKNKKLLTAVRCAVFLYCQNSKTEIFNNEVSLQGFVFVCVIWVFSVFAAF